MVPWYHNNKMTKTIARVQTGVRIEKRLLKVLKGLAEQLCPRVQGLLDVAPAELAASMGVANQVRGRYVRID